jgi:serine/threonine-protein kinase
MAKELKQRYQSAMAMLRDIAIAQSKPNREKGFTDDVDLPTQFWQPTFAEKRPPPKSNFWPWALVYFGISFVLVILLSFFAYNFFSPVRPQVQVPNLVGKELTEAREILRQNNLKIKIINQIFSTNYPLDTIVSQTPSSGQERRGGSEIQVVLSKGPELVRVPLLTGKTRKEAELALEEIGLEVGDVLDGADQQFPEGTVIKQLPESNTQIERGAKVSITLNSSSNLVEVPNYIGRKLSDVRAELGGLGLTFNQASPTTSNIYEPGIIIDQQPVPYSKVATGTAISFIVSSGPPST